MDLKNNWLPDDSLKNTDVNDIANNVNENTKHKDSVINTKEYVHGLKYNDNENVLILNTTDGEVAIGGSNSSNEIEFDNAGSNLTSNNVEGAIKENDSNLKEHKESRVSDAGGIHGMEFLEADGTLMIEKHDGQKIKFESGMNPDDLLSGLVDITNECIEKVGVTIE